VSSEMKKRKDVDEILNEMVKKDHRYAQEAYEFISAGLAYTVQKAEEPRHVTGKELCEGLRELAVDEFGVLAHTVLASWGIHRTEDFGEIVFNLIAAGLFGKTETDSREDFADVYDFANAFGHFELHLKKDT